MTRRTPVSVPVSRRRALVTMVAGLGMLVTACGPGSNPGAASPASGAAGAGPVAGTVKGPFEGQAAQLTGAGATFPAPLYTKWFSDYQGIAGVQVNYQAIGSGGGIKAITDKTVDFGASDAPMTEDQMKAAGGPMLHIPMTLGAVVPIVNIPEL